MADEKNLDISTRTILKISFTIIAFYFLFLIKDILVLFLFALIISILFNPAIDFFQKRKIPRIMGIFLVYFGVFGFFSFLIYLVVPIFSDEIKQFLQSFPQYFGKISPLLRGLGFQAFENTQSFIVAMGANLEKMSDSIFNVVFAIFGGVFTSLFVLTTAIFISLEEKLVERVLILIFPKKYETLTLNIWRRCQKKVAGWFGARILTCLFVAVASYIVFLIFNVKYPFTLAIFAGAFNFIPYIGPLLTGILLFVLIFPTEMLKAIFVLITFILIQQIDNNILSPILMKKIIGLPPVLVLISIVVGGKIWGFLGAILVIPLAGILFEFITEFLEKRKAKEIEISS